jgi:hypothetical protein
LSCSSNGGIFSISRREKNRAALVTAYSSRAAYIKGRK